MATTAYKKCGYPENCGRPSVGPAKATLRSQGQREGGRVRDIKTASADCRVVRNADLGNHHARCADAISRHGRLATELLELRIPTCRKAMPRRPFRWQTPFRLCGESC